MRAHVVLVTAGLIAVLSGAPAVAAAQVEIDRIVSRVGDRIVTQSDIRQARALRLVDETSSDESTQRALETRLLILHELSRAAPLPPSGAADLEARRAEWSASVGGEGRVAELLRQGSMSEGDLDGWLRDDLRIRAYLRRQFGMLGDVERSRAMEDWLSRLRQRADLPQ
jgi:hypothetical protein